MDKFNSNNIPKLTVVGAGPGDPELITLKAINVLRQADVILYDALANPQLLDYSHPFAEKIFVGKKGHYKSVPQDVINQLIVEKAYQKGHVVRLKGGDPFVFGRGIEELEYAKKRGLEIGYIPGISSILSGGTHFIPLTDRRVADSFWVITGHKSDKSFSADIEVAVNTKATVVLLMAMSKLSFIQSKFIEANKENLSFCLIQHASTPLERKVIGKIENLVEIAEKEKMTNPAVLLIGEVVKFNKELEGISTFSHELYK